MMATGGYVVVAPNGGNKEYIEDEVNCLTYNHDIQEAIDCINRIVDDEELRAKLLAGEMETVSSRDWKNISEDILRMYVG